MTIEIKKFGEFLTSRPAGREAALVFIAYLKKGSADKKVVIDFDGVKVMTPSWLSEFVQTLRERELKDIAFKKSENPTVISSIEIIELEK